MLMEIVQWNEKQAEANLPQLVELLQHCVDAGASIGFLPPLAAEEALAYWQGNLPQIDLGERALFVALADGRVVGAVQLALEARPNGNHRVEVQKLMVHTEMRRRGIASQLMAAAHAYIGAVGRELAVLDTRKGDPAESLYQKLGYIKAGEIPNFARNPDGTLAPTVLYYRVF